MNELLVFGVLVTGVARGVLAFAPQLSESLVRTRARRLPPALGSRMGEEWLAELDALSGPASRLAFAVALALTRRHSFGMDEDGPFATPSRPSVTFGTFNGWPTIVTLTTIVVAACAYGASFLIPPLYQAQARIRVVPTVVPEQYVQQASRIPFADRWPTLNEIVLSHTRIAQVVLEFDLYPAMRPAGSMSVPDDVIAGMRQDISVEFGADGRTIDVAYVSQQPQTALKVTERLAGLYIGASLRDREDSDRAANEFLDAQIEDVRARILKHAAVMHPSDVDPSQAAVQTLEHEILQSAYRDLLVKKEQAAIATSIERRQIGETFRLVDPPRLPETPIRPNRPLIGCVGAAVGFCLGMGMMLTGRRGPFRRPEKALVQS
jgi:capsular polysaccharide biosynthesis protein